MATTENPYSPPFTTETDEPPPWTDCTWASGLMFANKGDRGGHPNTRAEREALRKASRDNFAGSTLQDLSHGLLARYGWGLGGIRVSEASLLARLKRGDGAVVQGNYHLLTRHFQRWDVRFAARSRALHAAYVQGHDRGGNWHVGPNGVLRDVFWCDPLGRSPRGTPADEAYRGEWMPVPVLLRFLSGLGDQAHRYCTTVQDGQHR